LCISKIEGFFEISHERFKLISIELADNQGGKDIPYAFFRFDKLRKPRERWGWSLSFLEI